MTKFCKYCKREADRYHPYTCQHCGHLLSVSVGTITSPFRSTNNDDDNSGSMSLINTIAAAGFDSSPSVDTGFGGFDGGASGGAGVSGDW